MLPEPPDSAEVDALLEMLRSPGYALVVDRIQAAIERLRTDLEEHRPPEETAVFRGAIKAYRTALRIPQILIDEIKAGLK